MVLDTLQHLLRDAAPQVLGAVVRRYGDFAAAEDAVQEAMIAAAAQWPRDGVPANPRGWLFQVAARRMTDYVRSETARRKREALAFADPPFGLQVTPDTDADAAAVGDDTLILLFMCSHPALTRPSAIALTLRAVGGLTTAEIARAFLVPESTMAQRISRAKATIKASGIPFAMPSAAERDGRLDAVLHVLYLMFNEGYASTSGPQVHRTDLSNEAIRLARILHALLPRDPEVGGLLALMLLTDARRCARTGPDGELIPLDEQDRSVWDRRAIEEGVTLTRAALAHGAVGPYQVQAAIAALHDEATATETTDWPQIATLYGLLARMSANPMVELNRAIAVAMVDGPNAGLQLLDALDRDTRLAGHYRLAAVRAHLLERAGQPAAAIDLYRAAAARTTSVAERNYLMMKAARLSADDETRATRRE